MGGCAIVWELWGNGVEEVLDREEHVDGNGINQNNVQRDARAYINHTQWNKMDS